MRRANLTLKARAASFADRAAACDGTNLSADVKAAEKAARDISSLMSSTFGGKVYTCPANVCRTTTTLSARRRLVDVAATLFRVAKRTKVQAGIACKHPPPEKDEPRRRKVTDDYFRELVDAIMLMPRQVTRCP